MVAAFTADDLLTRVQDDLTLPDADGRLGATAAERNAAQLRFADRVMRQQVAGLISSPRQGVWMRAASTAIVSGTSRYALPVRALGETLEDVAIVDATVSPEALWSAPEIETHDRWRFTRARGPWDSPYAYAWYDNAVELLPHPTETRYTLRVLYLMRPSRLVTVSLCAQVASTTSTTITAAATVPSGWGSSETLDVVDGSTGRLHQIDAAGTSISGTSITISAGVSSDIAAGDYVCLAGQTCVPGVSESLYDVLVDGTSLAVARAILDPEDVADAERRLAESMSHAGALIKPRSRGAVRKLVPHYAPHRRGRRMR